MAPVPCRKHSADAISRKKVDRRQIGAQYEMIARQYLERAGLHFTPLTSRYVAAS